MIRRYLGIINCLFVFALLTASIGCCHGKIPNITQKNNALKIEKIKDNSGFHFQSAVFIFVSPQPDPLMSSIFGESWPEIQRSFVHTGSGVVISTDKLGSDVVTAGHVCQQSGPNGEPTPWNIKINVFDWMGNEHEAIIIKYSLNPDLCLLRIPGKILPESVDIADKDPKLGTNITNTGYPLGVYIPGAPLMFNGTYAGTDIDGDHIYTVPVAPGSSGSAVLNEDGEIIGIIFAAVAEFPHVAIATPWHKINKFLYEK